MKFTYQGNTYDLILFSLAGSRFYGTHYDGPGSVDEDGNSREHPFNPEYKSDSDYRGIFVSSPDTKLGMTGKIEEIEVKKGKNGKVPEEQQELIKELNEKLGLDMPLDEDVTLYEIKKFITLALDNNPNIMDLIYADKKAVIYKNKKGKKLLKSKDIFMSTKTKFTFSGYALSQLKRTKNHNKWVVKYPKTGVVLKLLKQAFDAGDIDYNFITDHFGGNVSEFSTGIKQQDANKLGKVVSMNWDEFVDLYNEFNGDSISKDEWNRYRKPQLIEFCYPKDLKAAKIPLDSEIEYNGNNVTVRDFLLTQASFRTISKTQYNIFTPFTDNFKGGIFTRGGNMKVNDPEEVGEFKFQLTIDENNYKKELDNISKLWDWKCHRNEKRSILEDNVGYDTKHMSHTCRLLIGAKNILTTGDYEPRLKGDNLKLVKSVLNGEKTYDELLELAETMEKELENLYKSSTLPKNPNYKKANELLLELSRKL